MVRKKNQAEIDIAIRLHSNGVSANQIAKKLGWSTVTVIAYLRKAGVYKKPGGRPGRLTIGKVEKRILPHLREIHEENAKGTPVHILAKRYSVSRVRLYELLRKHYYTFPERSLAQLNKPLPVRELIQLAKDVNNE